MPVSGFGQTLPTSNKKQVGRLDYGGHSERKQLQWIVAFRNPNEVMRFLIDDALRRIQCWLHPTGLFVAVLGPDGVGKSTIIKRLIDATGTAFRSNWVAHWRPMSLWRGKHTSAVTDPHGQVTHSPWWSVARVFCHVMDYWFGYWWKIRPMLARSNLVVFDRYFYDLIIDPRRYRYGGPRWLVRALSPLIPRPDLVFVLEAPDEVVLSRKQEVTPQEVQRQRRCYRQLANKMANANLVRTDQEIEQVVRTVSEELTDLLARRFHQQHSSCALQTTAVAN
jgi:thymidylate kinase